MKEKVIKVYGVGYPFCLCVPVFECTSCPSGVGRVVFVCYYVSVMRCIKDEGHGHGNARLTWVIGKNNEGVVLLLTGTLRAELNMLFSNEALRRVLACGVCRRTFSLEDWRTCQKIGD